MTDRYENIRRALEMELTPGPWEALSNLVRTHPIQGEMGGFLVAECPANIGRDLEDAAHIAACDPDTIRELLAERDQLAAENARLRVEVERLTAAPPPAAARVDVTWPLSILEAGNWREVYMGTKHMRLAVSYPYEAWERLMAALAAAQQQQQPAEGEDIMVNTPYDVFILPLRPSGLDGKGPRFVVHVPADAMLRAVQDAWMNDPLRRTAAMWQAMLAAAQHRIAELERELENERARIEELESQFPCDCGRGP